MAAASVYGACRCNGRSRTLEDVIDPARVGQSRVRNAYQTLNTDLRLPAQPVPPSAFVPRLASQLSDTIRHRARRLAEESESMGVTMGVRPSGFAAACVYTAEREEGRWLAQSEVAEVANVSVVTVRTHRTRWTNWLYEAAPPSGLPSCGASIPIGQKWRFCLTNHFDSRSPIQPTPATEQTFLGTIHLVVDSSTFYGAVAKDRAAAKLLESSETEQTVDDCTLIHDLDSDPTPQLVDRWPTLSAAMQLDSIDGSSCSRRPLTV